MTSAAEYSDSSPSRGYNLAIVTGRFIRIYTYESSRSYDHESAGELGDF